MYISVWKIFWRVREIICQNQEDKTDAVELMSDVGEECWYQDVRELLKYEMMIIVVNIQLCCQGPSADGESKIEVSFKTSELIFTS